MAQETILESLDEPSGKVMNDALVVCESCKQLVPRTMVCLYCGAPILFKRPREKRS
jgi:rRNA maturation endonuclease Nob1